MYRITYSDGRTADHETYGAAVEAIQSQYVDAEIGHSGDLSDGGDRTLCWADGASSVDDGINAIAKIEGHDPADDYDSSQDDWYGDEDL